MEVVWVGRKALFFVLDVAIGWGISPVATIGQDGCTTMSHPAYFGATFGMGDTSGVLVAPGASAVVAVGAEGLLPSSLGGLFPRKLLHP